MKTTIEEIHGELCTTILNSLTEDEARKVVRTQEPAYLTCSAWLKDDPNYKQPVSSWSPRDFDDGFDDDGDEWFKVVHLPALPRNPKPKHARLIYRYMAEGIDLRFEITDAELKCENGLSFADIVNHIDCCPIEITHAIHAETGERVEIAIKENDDA